MLLSFRKVNYDTEDEQDMTKLQYVLDGIDVKERVKAKTKIAALFSYNTRDGQPLPGSPTNANPD